MKILVQNSTLRSYRRRLTNLSSRNRSLLLSSLPVDQFLDLHDTDYVLNKPSFWVIQQLIARKASIPLCDVLDPRHERANLVSKKLRRIARTTQFIEEERGTEDLYVGWPFVRGQFMDGTSVHGPLLFFPVQIEQKGDQWHLIRRGDEEAFINPTFTLAYAHFNAVKLPAEYVEKEFDDFDKDALAFRTQLYEWLKSSPFKINFNQDLFIDLLKPFDKVNQKTLLALEKTGEIKLYPEAVLGIFPQAGSFLVPDYDELIGGREEIDVNREELTDTSPSSPLSPVSFLNEKFLRTPLPLDASQEAAVRAVKAGESLVVQGPPGTGKSQLIANLMADAAAEGKRVLLVCQKRAALDVVYARLRDVGMERFIALIHDFQDDRKALYTQLAGQIEAIDNYRQQNNGLDAVLIERDFDRESNQIDELVADLQSFKDALFNTAECGISPKELYLSSNPLAGIIALDDVYPQFPLTGVDNFVQRLANYAGYQKRVGPGHPWHDRLSFAGFSTADQFVIDRAIANVQTVATAANLVAMEQLAKSLLPAAWLHWHESAWAIGALLALLTGENSRALWTAVQFLRASPDHTANTIAEGELLRLADVWDGALAAPGPLKEMTGGRPRSLRPDSVLGNSVPEMSSLATLLDSALIARDSWVSWNWWQMTNSGKDQLRQLAQVNGLTTSAEDLRTLQVRLHKSQILEQLRPQTDALLAQLPLPNAPDTLRLLQQAHELTARIADLPVLTTLPTGIWVSVSTFTDSVRAILAQALTVSEAVADWQPYLTETQIDAIWTDKNRVNVLQKSLRADFDLLIENDRIWANFSEAEKTVSERLTDKTEPVQMFMNSLRLSWLNHLEQQFPVLRSVSSLKMGQQEEALQDSIQKKQQLSRDILGMHLRQQTYRNLAFNRLNNITTYRDLLHQTTKKRNIWPVRRLMSQYADEVFRLVPCWMASPESVSAIFPLQEGLFDLVIFDEASQCFAENGVPAMFRGKQVIITGDSQQLRPSDLYRTRIEDEQRSGDPDDDEVDQTALEVESLLELAAQSLAQVSLTGHYRSRSLDLIQFSNEHFYQNKLSMLPDRQTLNERIPAIRYQLVPGLWQQNTNPVEAEAVVKLVEQLATDLPGRSIGVVTFNFPQQQLIQEMLETSGTAVTFVKNIENVQGDECDIIIFSVGYAPDSTGRLAMQFGSLNMAGGANRLNVAVTRARERVYVITSLRPGQLTVDNVANDGPRLLKAYLTYAQDVSEGRFQPLPRQIEGLRVAHLLKSNLATQHPNWQPELSVADLTIREGDQYAGLVLTDDDQYYGQTIKEAHALLPFALRNKQWPYERHWSREFWKDA